MNEMKNIYSHSIKLLIIILFFNVSCRKIIDIDIPAKDRKIVINSLICTDSVIKVNISRSLNILDIVDFKYLSNAEVNLYENDLDIGRLDYKSNGTYLLPGFYPTENRNYRIKVSVPEMKTATAEAFIPKQLHWPITIDTSMGVTTGDPFYAGYYYCYEQSVNCVIRFKDDGNTENYYWFNIWGNRTSHIWDYQYSEDSLINEPSYLYFNSDDPIIDSWVKWGERGFVFSDKLYNGKNIEFKISICKDAFGESDTIVVYFNLCNINKDYYLYTKSLEMHMEVQEDPIAEPVQVYTNVENGLGIFSGYSALTDSISFIGYGYEGY